MTWGAAPLILIAESRTGLYLLARGVNFGSVQAGLCGGGGENKAGPVHVLMLQRFEGSRGRSHLTLG